jgi:enamine deaminase RidA (YjgF/YER057c/UK114 family)
MNIEYANPSSMPPPHGYSQVVTVEGSGKMVFISGQVAANTTGNIVGLDSLEEQAHQTFTNIKSALEAAGGGMEHLVKLNNYLKDINQIGLLRTIRDLYINTQHPPASTTIQTVFDDVSILVEIDAIAIIPV